MDIEEIAKKYTRQEFLELLKKDEWGYDVKSDFICPSHLGLKDLSTTNHCEKCNCRQCWTWAIKNIKFKGDYNMENFIMIDGKKIELSEETVKNIKEQFIPKENRFVTDWERKHEECFFSVNEDDSAIEKSFEYSSIEDDDYHKNVNYFRNKKLAEWVAVKQLLDRKLLKFSMQHGGEKIIWDKNNGRGNNTIKYRILYDYSTSEFTVQRNLVFKNPLSIDFSSEEVAKDAIKIFKDDILEVMKLRKEYIEDEAN